MTIDAVRNLLSALDGAASMCTAVAGMVGDLELQAALMDAAARVRDVAGDLEAAIKAAERETEEQTR